MCVHPDRNQVHAVRPEGTAAHEPPGRQGQSPPKAEHRERLDGIVRAARIEPARRHPARGRALVHPDEGDGRPGRTAPRSLGRAHRSPHACPARRSAVATSARSSAGASDAAPGPRRTRYEPRGSRGASARTTSRARRRSRLRTTAVPHWRPIAYPTCGNNPGVPSSTGAKRARTGPLDPRTRERCSSAKAARLVIRPTFRAGTMPQTVRRWRPLSRRDFRMARPARVDMRLRKPWVFARLRVLGWYVRFT